MGGRQMIVRLEMKEIVVALGTAAVRKMGGCGSFVFTLTHLEMRKNESGEVKELYATLEILEGERST